MTRDEARKAMLTGRRVWHRVLECRCDVHTVFAKTATVRYWGEGLNEGKLVTLRGVPLVDLSFERKCECDVCYGSGKAAVYCEVCGHALTDENESREHPDSICRTCENAWGEDA